MDLRGDRPGDADAINLVFGPDGALHAAVHEDHLYHCLRKQSGWETETVDDSDGFEGDMEVGVGGTVHIAHDDWFYRDLYYAGKDSSGWYIEVVSWSGSRGWSPSMYLVFSDNPHIFHSRSSSSEIVWWGSDSLSIGEGPDPGPDPGHGETIIAVSGNPVRSSSEVRLMIPQAGEYELSVFDMAGRRNRVLFRGHLDEGEYDMFFDPASLQEGAYFLRPTGGTVDCSRSVIVLE